MVSVVIPEIKDVPIAHVAIAAVLTATLAYKVLVPSNKQKKTASGIQVRKPHRLPTSQLILGDIPEIAKNAKRFNDWIYENCVRFNGEPWIRRIPMAPDVMFISTPELIEDVTKTQNDVFRKKEFNHELFYDLIGDSFFSQDGEEWHRQRKIASRFFSQRMLRDYATGVINKHAAVMFEVMEKARVDQTPVDMTRLAYDFTLETFAEMGFGLCINGIGSSETHPLQKGMDESMAHILRRVQSLPWVWKLQRFLNIGEEKKYRKVNLALKEFVSELVTQSMVQSSHKKREEAATLVDLFIESMQDGESDITPELIRNLGVSFVLGGRDTTADTLNWFLYEILSHPQVEANVRAELCEKVPELMEGKISALTMEQAFELTYLEAVIRETLRLHPVIPLNGRCAVKDTVLVDGTFVPKGTNITLASYALSRMESVWGPDAAEFNPGRWLNSQTGEMVAYSSFKAFSFHAGPRICIGMNLAMLELRLVISVLLSRFNLKMEPNDGQYRFSATLSLKNPLILHVSPAPAKP
ncbi:hypothetical protein Poli38472_009453 [Pythium oligandrum]|uniref:Cytochrome P450 n=1 Tax=Pythium oligandrum TaxID=41045 RepID=A0A8K1CEY3_PYTOL|nr:hypothetical protein Poli38472_009453 [Pythium oligandrum]|eukprot:TMW61960.1 hypothetical protein Poli38472_009453 [Pythium oligandrum]